MLAMFFYSFSSIAQQKVTQEQARSICAQQMAAFTKAVSGAYQKGFTYEQFQNSVCGKSAVTTEGAGLLKAAFSYLQQGASNDVIVKNNQGKEVAASLSYFLNLHNKGIESDGSELFGGRTGVTNNSFSKNVSGGCKWYQFWCLVQTVTTWVVGNWQFIRDLSDILSGPVIAP